MTKTKRARLRVLSEHDLEAVTGGGMSLGFVALTGAVIGGTTGAAGGFPPPQVYTTPPR